MFKKKDTVIVKYQNKYIKGKLVNLLINGGIKLKINGETKELFYGEQII